MNPVFILCCNNLALTKRCVESARKQDIETQIFCIDNGSLDDTAAWLESEGILLEAFPLNSGFSYGMNYGIRKIFEMGVEYVLATGTDTFLPPYYYRRLRDSGLDVVTGTSAGSTGDLMEPEACLMMRPNPDFSSILYRKDAWQKLGGFDESMMCYCQDCCLHLRAHRMGIKMYSVNVPFLHEASATVRLSGEVAREDIKRRANVDHANFVRKYGFEPGSTEYTAQFSPEMFGMDC